MSVNWEEMPDHWCLTGSQEEASCVVLCPGPIESRESKTNCDMR